jgi:hypothetical protein
MFIVIQYYCYFLQRIEPFLHSIILHYKTVCTVQIFKIFARLCRSTVFAHFICVFSLQYIVVYYIT